VRYNETHAWVERENDKKVIIGISDRAQRSLGEIVFVELPDEGDEFEQDDPIGTIESIDGTIVNLYAPVSGEIIEVNTALDTSPDLINKSPEGDGWIFKMRMEVPKEYNGLMTPEEYDRYEGDILDFEDNEYEDDEDFY
jgi:glycine cleavage system H protein